MKIMNKRSCLKFDNVEILHDLSLRKSNNQISICFWMLHCLVKTFSQRLL